MARKKIIYSVLGLLAATFVAITPLASAQMMTTGMGSNISADEQTGKDLYAQLQNNQKACSQLSDDDFDHLGDFFMGRMMGGNHGAMDQYMDSQLGASTERQVHIVMGKRMSGCDTNAAYPTSSSNYAPLAWMGMMGQNANSWGMMGGYGMGGWSATDTTLSVLLILAVGAALWGWLLRPARTVASPIAVLKARYAKGDITNAEFIRLKKDIE